MGGLFFPNVYSIHASLYNWEKLSFRKNYWKIYQTEEKRLSGSPHLHRVPAIRQSLDRERREGGGAQGQLAAAATSQSRQTHRGRPGDLPKGEVAVVGDHSQNMKEMFSGKGFHRIPRETFPLHLLADRGEALGPGRPCSKP